MELGRMTDLSHFVQAGMPVFPGDPTPEFVRVSEIQDKGYRLTRIVMGSHTGTHIDAPSHMLAGGAPVDKVPLDRLMGDAVVLDVTQMKPGEGIFPRDMPLDEVRQGDMVLLCTGMGAHWGDARYLTNYPYLEVEGARALLERGVKAVGIDWLSIERYGGVGHPVHDLLLSRGVPIIESLANLDGIKGRRVSLICLPLKLKGIDGAPARAVAFEV